MKSVKNIQKITKAMKMVAASKLRAIQVRAENSRGLWQPFTALLGDTPSMFIFYLCCSNSLFFSLIKCIFSDIILVFPLYGSMSLISMIYLFILYLDVFDICAFSHTFFTFVFSSCCNSIGNNRFMREVA